MTTTVETSYIHLFGAPHIQQTGEAGSPSLSRKGIALLAYLVHQETAIDRVYLADLLWPGKSETRGRNNLSVELNRLSALLPNAFETDYHTLRFIPTAHIEFDCLLLQQKIEAATPHPPLLSQAITYLKSANTAADFTPDKALADWVRAGGPDQLAAGVRLYGGEFLAGLWLRDCADYELWLTQTRNAWQQQMVSLLETLAAYYTLAGEVSLAQHYLEQWLEIEPWQQQASQLTMLMLTRQGQRQAALDYYEAYQKALEMPALPETQALIAEIETGAIAPWSD
ncbi:MAG: bacterial transcriptional activator domain-containing protein, partial [Chloroflexota bacterium]